MKFYSEETRNFYNSAEECAKAEEELRAKKEQEEQQANKLKEERKARAEEVETLLKEWKAAEKAYREALSKFLKDYGTFHYSTHLNSADDWDSWSSLFSPFTFWL